MTKNTAVFRYSKLKSWIVKPSRLKIPRISPIFKLHEITLEPQTNILDLLRFRNFWRNMGWWCLCYNKKKEKSRLLSYISMHKYASKFYQWSQSLSIVGIFWLKAPMFQITVYRSSHLSLGLPLCLFPAIVISVTCLISSSLEHNSWWLVKTGTQSLWCIAKECSLWYANDGKI